MLSTNGAKHLPEHEISPAHGYLPALFSRFERVCECRSTVELGGEGAMLGPQIWFDASRSRKPPHNCSVGPLSSTTVNASSVTSPCVGQAYGGRTVFVVFYRTPATCMRSRFWGHLGWTREPKLPPRFYFTLFNIVYCCNYCFLWTAIITICSWEYYYTGVVESDVSISKVLLYSCLHPLSQTINYG
jgi:hypothetical protein